MQRFLYIFLLTTVIHSSVVAHNGYYRQPTIHGDKIVFVAEGDLWSVSVGGGRAVRLTTHLGEELHPALSPNGQHIAFCAEYEGPQEVYVMPTAGGVPKRLTYGSYRPEVVGWDDNNCVLLASSHRSTLPEVELLTIDPVTFQEHRIPLAQASDGVYDERGGTLFFTRYPFQGSHVKRYHGGLVQQIWKYAPGMDEAIPLTDDYQGTSRDPMWYRERVYFVSDRDQTMNIWSMTLQGDDLRQHTFHNGWDVKTPSLHNGRIVYQLGADLYLLDLTSQQTNPIPIVLTSDFDQMRETWITEPASFLTSIYPSPDGDRVALTARGEVFVAPRKPGRLIQVTHQPGVRYRQAQFMPDGNSILALSDESGELEFWLLPADGIGTAEELTDNGQVFRFNAVISPDGKWIAYQDKNWEMWLIDVEQKTQQIIARADHDPFQDVVWSPDSQWLAYVNIDVNLFRQIMVYSLTEMETTAVTSDRVDSYSPAWTPDGQWMYFLSDRHLESVVSHPWGNFQPEPFLDKKTKMYALPLTEPMRSPFKPDDELTPDPEDDTEEDDSENDDLEGAEVNDVAEETAEEEVEEEIIVELNTEDIVKRAIEVPVPPGNYSNLTVTDDALFWESTLSGSSGGADIQALKISKEPAEIITIADGASDYRLTFDHNTLLVRKGERLYLIDATAAKADLSSNQVALDGWSFALDPQEEWRQMLVEAWRLQRDYFYTSTMHGVDWEAVLEKYLPLTYRITSRTELSDLIAQMCSELSALHTYVYGGDQREPSTNISQGFLGARLIANDANSGCVIEHIFLHDPNYPDRRGPLMDPEFDIQPGDTIKAINGVATPNPNATGHALRDQAGKQVRMTIRSRNSSEEETKEYIITPMTTRQERSLRYGEWEYTRRMIVDELSDGTIGYVHLRAMGGDNFTQWAENFYPAHDRQGFIIDVRHNNGGNIDSWILGRLQRKPWMYWQGRVGKPSWNMQYGFHGYLVVICDARTFSDGETFVEGFKRLGLGKAIGTRTSGGGIWLTFSTILVDRGAASAAEFGIYGPEGQWLIEGTGVEPDIVVDNLPHGTFKGEDAQLNAAIEHLLMLIEKEPVEVPIPPPPPNKSVPENAMP